MPAVLPTVHYDWSSVGRVHSLDFFEELKHANRGQGYAKIRPTGEMQLSDQPWSSAAISSMLQNHTSLHSKHVYIAQQFIQHSSLMAWLIPKESKIFLVTKLQTSQEIQCTSISVQYTEHLFTVAVMFLREMTTHVLHTELPDCVVHQHCDILQCHPHTAVDPAALLRPVLITLFLHFTQILNQILD